MIEELFVKQWVAENPHIDFKFWLMEKLQAAEARAATVEQERDYQTRRAESLQQTLSTINNDNDVLRRQLAEAQAKLKSALNEVDDDVTRLQWLQSMITMVTVNIEVVSGCDVDAGLMCISEVQALHDDLKKLVSNDDRVDRMLDASGLQRFECTAPADWRYADWKHETPLGQALDGLGDEVEP